MNLVELRTFLAIVETGSLVRASEVMNCTQSTVTVRLKSLEGEVGQTLINRNKSGATVTPAGQRLKHYASTISDLWRQVQSETKLPSGTRTICNFACHPDLWQGLGQRFTRSIRTAVTDIGMSVWEGGHREMQGWLEDGLADVILTHWPKVRPPYRAVQIGVDRLILVSSEPNATIRFNPDYVFVEAGPDFARDHAVAYSDAGTARLSFGTARLGMEHLFRNGGSAYLPERLVGQYISTVGLHLLDAPVFERPYFLVFNETATRNWDWFDDCVADIQSPPTQNPNVRPL